MRPPQINLSQLVTFYFVAKHQSFTLASEQLCITQPAVSTQLKSLEKQFGVKLIDVRRKKATLTREGELLFEYAEAIYHAAMRAERLLQQRGEDRQIRIGISAALTLYLLHLIDRFEELHPTVRVKVREGPSLRIVEELLDDKHDLCVVGALAEVRGKLDAYHLRQTERMVLVAAPDDPLAQLNQVRWEHLDRYPLILHCEGSVARKVILKEFQKRGIEANIVSEIDNIEGMRQLIRKGKGIGLMFLPNVREDIANRKLKILPFDSGDVQMGIDVLVRRGRAVPPPCKAFISLLEEHFRAVADDREDERYPSGADDAGTESGLCGD